MINIAIFLGRVVAWHYIIRGVITIGHQIGDHVREEALAAALAKTSAQA